ncbi:hypothetical protein AB0D09_05775 [Streptomyces sp. NPDC049097]
MADVPVLLSGIEDFYVALVFDSGQEVLNLSDPGIRVGVVRQAGHRQ